jgi:F420-0:gamma-glutamyl ligase
MNISPIKTRIFLKNESLLNFIKEHLPEISEKTILMITSKIVALSQGLTVSKNQVTKKDLVKDEADEVLGETYQTYLTIKNGILIPAAGIDESNAQDEYILWPHHPYETTKSLWTNLREHYGVKDLGVIFTDSRCTPLRQGVSGIGISHWGFEGIQNHIGKKDLFNREITMSTTNVVDCLASAGVLVMGESNESCPLATMTNYNGIQFVEKINPSELLIEKDRDIFKPLFKK